MRLSTTLFVIFLVLKLTGVITWSWWLVTMPLWIGFAILGVSLIGLILVGGVVTINGKVLTRKK